MFATEKQEKILKSVSQHATPVGPRQSSVNLLDIEDAKPTHHKTATTKSCSNIMADIKSASSESFTREEAGTPKGTSTPRGTFRVVEINVDDIGDKLNLIQAKSLNNSFDLLSPRSTLGGADAGNIFRPNSSLILSHRPHLRNYKVSHTHPAHTDDTDQDQKRESQNEQNESGFVDASKQTETINSQKDDSKHQETNESQQPADNSREDEKNIPDHKETDDLSEMEVKSKEKSEVDDPGSTDNFEKPGSDGSLASSTGYTASVEYCSDQEQHSDHSCSAASSSYAELCRAVSSKSGDSVPRTSTPVAGRAVSLKKMRNSRSTSHSSVSSDDDWTNIIDESSTNNELAEKCSDIVKKLDEVQTQLLKKPCSSILKRQSESSGSENRSSDSEADHSHLHHGSSRVTFNEPVSTSYNQNATRKTAPIPVPVSVASNMAAKSVPVAKVAGSVETMPASASVPVSADKLKQLMSSSALLEQLRASMMQSSRVDGDVASSRTSMPSEMIDTFLHSILQDALQHQDTEADEESDDDDVVQKVMSELIQLASRSEGQIPAQRLTAMHMQVSPSFGAPAANVAHSSHIRSVSRANTQIDNANTPTPSKMLRESQNKNYGGFQSRQSSKMQAYPTPSELLQKMLSQENHEKNAKGKDSFANYPTVSQLLNIKQMETPREKKVKEKEKKADEEEPIIRYTTPSLLIQRIQDRERTEEVAHQKSILDYTTPSRLIQKTQDRERTEEVAHQKSILDYTTPSRLIQKIQDKSNERLIGNSIPSMQKDSSEIFLTVAELIARIHEREAGVKTSPETIRYMTGPTGSSHYSPDLTPSHHRTSPTSFHDPMDQRPSLLLQMGLDKESLIHTARRKSSSELVHCSSSSSVSSRPSQLLEEYSRIIAEKEIMGDQTAHRDTTRKPGKRSSGEAEISSGREDSDSREQWNAILSWLSLQPKQSQERARSDLMNRPCQSQDADRKNVPTSDDTEQILLRDENVPSSPGVADTEFSKKNALQSGISVENRDGKNVSDTLNTSSSNDRYMEDQWNAILSWLSLNRSSLCDVDRAVVERDDNQPRGVLDQNGPQPRGVLDQNGPQPRGVSEQGDPRLADGDDQELKAKQIGKVKDQHADVMGSAETKDEKLSSGPEENPEFSASSYTWMQVVDGRSKEGIKDRGSTVASQTDPQGGATISQDKHSALFDGKNVKIPPPPNSSASSDGTNHKESTCSISPSDFLIESVVKLFEKARREDRRKMMMEMMEGNEYGIKDFSSHIAKDALEKDIEDKTQERLRIYRGQKAMNSKDKSSERHVKYSTDSLTASSHPSGATERSHEKLHKADKYLNRKLIAIDTGVRGRGTGRDRERGGEGVTGRGGGNVTEPGGGVTGRGGGNVAEPGGGVTGRGGGHVAEPGGGVTGRGRGNDDRVTNTILSSSPSPLVSLLGHSGHVQMSGASLPTSRGASPSADQLLNSSRRRAAANDAHSFLVEKEMIESQLRKLQVENSTLQTENKLIKEKYNRAQTRIEYLESQLAVTRNVADTLHEEMNDELTVYKRRNRDQTERDRDGLQQKIISLTKELELVRAENTSLEKQLDGLRKTADFARSSADKSKIVDGYKMQVNALRDELQQTKEVLQRCENARQEEVDRRKDASTQIIKLTEMKALLQQELEQQGGGSVADRQVKSLERRLKITEDRLHQERSDRAGKLSEVEEKLINDNARLQVSEKEMRRQLSREREKLKNVDQKFREMKLENERLRVQVMDRPMSSDSMPFHVKWEALRAELGSKKQTEQYKRVVEQIKKEDNLGAGQEQEIVWLLWQRKEELSKRLSEWELILDDLDINHDDVKDGLQVLRDERGLYEERIGRYKDTLDDLNKEKDNLNSTYKRQVADLVQDKHSTQSRVKTLEDMNASINAENESLKSSLRAMSGLPPSTHGEASTWQAQVTSLQSDLQVVKGDLERQLRTNKVLQAEIESVRTQLQAKEAALDEALGELGGLGGAWAGEDVADRRQLKIDRLNAEIKGLQVEVSHWRSKSEEAERDRSQLDDKIDQLAKKSSRSKYPDGGLSSGVESSKLSLETELHEKDAQVWKLTVQYNEAENELQRTKHLLLLQQQHAEGLNSQLDQLQTTLRQKNRVLENLSSAEGEFNANLTTLKENLASANRELTEKTAQLKMQSVQLESQHEKIAVLERDLTSRDELLSQRITEALQEGKLTSVLYEPLQSPRSTQETLTQAETKSRLLEYEKISVNNDLRRAQAAMESVVSENSELVARLRETRQELLTERATVCQITAEKVEADQKSHLFAEERDGLLREKARLMSDLAKHESTTATAIQKLELDHQRAELDLEQKYHSLNTEGKKLATELGTSQRLLEAREKEIDLLRDTIDHQKNEMLTLTRQMDVLREENSLARQDLDRLTNQLTSKMKEHAATAEVTQFLTNEKAKLQMEKFQLEKETSMEKGELERKHHQVHDLLAKMEKSEDKLRQTEKSLHQRETQLVGLETELRHVNKNVAMLESERAQLKVQVDKLNDELRGLTSMNSTLEQRLSMEKSTLGHEKTERSQLREELGLATRQMEIIKREYDIMNASLEAERKNAHALKEQCHLEEDKTFQLENRVKTQELEIETLKSHLVENRNTIDQYKKDKQTLYQDVQDLCRKLADKDELIARLQEKCNDTVETIQKEYLSDKTAISREKDDLENSLRKARDEIDDIKEHLRHKELQLEAYVRTHRELEQETKARETAESRVEKYETEMLDSKKTLSGLHAENVRLLDANKHIKENIEKAEQQISSLREQLKSQREEFTREIHVLKHTMSEETHRHMAERSQLQEQLSKSSAELKAAEASLHSLTEAKDSLHGTNKTHERTLDTLKTQLHEEVTARKLAEHRADNLQAELHGVKARRNNLDERVTDLQTQLSKTETELALEKDKYKRLKSDLSDSQNHSTTYEAQANTLQIQVTELQLRHMLKSHTMALSSQLSGVKAEVSSVRGQLDTLKQTSSAKNKKLLLELQQQLETFETERSKLLMQAQQLSVDLEQAREQVALKNRDNLSLQEQLLSLDATSREVSASLKQSQNAFHLEEEAREKLETRNHFLELENSRLRTHGDGESDPMMDVTRLEVNKMMSELTRQMQHQLEDQKEKDRLNRAKELKQAEESKKRVASLESSLSQEQSLHIITKTQLASVEDDNQRLRQQLQQARRKQHHSGEDRSKSRLEEINEIIARSQTRAHQLLATQGVYSPEDPLKTLSPSRDYLSSNPTMPLFLNTSPMSPQRSDGNRSLLSDDIHINGSPDSGRLLQTAPK